MLASGRRGQYLQVQLDAPDEATAAQQVDEICRWLLANPVIEDYRFPLEPAPTPATTGDSLVVLGRSRILPRPRRAGAGGGREVREVRVARLAPPDTELHGSGESYLIGSLVRGIGLLGLFTPERPAWSLTELVEHTGLNRTTLYRFLYTLRHLGLLDLDPATRRYRLGPRVLHLGFNYLRGLSLVERALPHLHALRDAV